MACDFQTSKTLIIDAGRTLYKLGLVAATGGNFSHRLDDGSIAMTVSGRDKGNLQECDVMRVDNAGKPLEEKRPSDETLLHTSLYQIFPETQAILHTHSIMSVVLSKLRAHDKALVLSDYEILKAFPGIRTHEAQVNIPIFDNDQDIRKLGEHIAAQLQEQCDVPCYIIRGHGAYAWGKDMGEAMRVTEALEYLLKCEAEMERLKGSNQFKEGVAA